MPSTEPVVERAVRERPILFSGPMVRAVLEGRKTQTRRVMKPQPTTFFFGQVGEHFVFAAMDSHGGQISCSYGLPGDRLWVRETFATDSIRTLYYATDDVHELRKKRPSIFMPRIRSRILLEVIEVRAQRLQEISAEDCIAEGMHTNLRESEACADLLDRYHRLWDSINGKSHPWASNPWVWAITFRRLAT